jgi:hypothetical protein
MSKVSCEKSASTTEPRRRSGRFVNERDLLDKPFLLHRIDRSHASIICLRKTHQQKTIAQFLHPAPWLHSILPWDSTLMGWSVMTTVMTEIDRGTPNKHTKIASQHQHPTIVTRNR